MRQKKSSGSVKAFYLKTDKLIKKLKNLAMLCKENFPEVIDIRIFGSIARGDETGLSDIDLFIIVRNCPDNPLERIKPFYFFFSEYIPLSLDIIVAKENELEGFQRIYKEIKSLLITD